MIYNDWIELIMKELHVTDKEASAIYKAMLLTRDILHIKPPSDDFMNKPE